MHITDILNLYYCFAFYRKPFTKGVSVRFCLEVCKEYLRFLLLY